MARAGRPATSLPLIELIDDPAAGVTDDGTYRLSDAQARAILELRLQRLTGARSATRSPPSCEEWPPHHRLPGNPGVARHASMAIMRDELREVKERFATPRRTETIDGLSSTSDVEDLIQREDMVVTVSHSGYIKRVPLLDLPRAEARRQGPLRHGTKDGGFGQPTCSSPTPTRPCCSSRHAAWSTS